MCKISENVSNHRTFRNNSVRIDEYFVIQVVKTVEKRESYPDHPVRTAEITNDKYSH
jgi:hypothetical protein